MIASVAELASTSVLTLAPQSTQRAKVRLRTAITFYTLFATSLIKLGALSISTIPSTNDEKSHMDFQIE